MLSANYEIINNSLFVIGSLDRSSDAEFQKALEKYVKATPPGGQVVDMSNVRWLAPSSAKVLIQVGQETQDKGDKMRVLASRHVMQTLNLLGAKTWLTIESCTTPTVKPGSVEADPKADSEAKTAPADEAEVSQPAAHEPEKTPVSAASTAPAGSISGVMPAVSAPPGSEAPAVTAVAAGGTLASPVETLSGGAHLLRALYINRRYSLHFYGGEQIVGILRGRVGGSWIMLDTHGTRKMINLDLVQYCEIL